MCAKALPHVRPRLAEFPGEPLVERAAGLGDHAPLLFEGRQVPVVEAGRLAAAAPYLLTFGIRGPASTEPSSEITTP
jgi:hypothetical protein